MAPFEYRVTCQAEDKPTCTYLVEVFIRYINDDGSKSGWRMVNVVRWTAKKQDRLAPYLLYQTLLRATLT
jgi:hypothetical protein